MAKAYNSVKICHWQNTACVEFTSCSNIRFTSTKSKNLEACVLAGCTLFSDPVNPSIITCIESIAKDCSEIQSESDCKLAVIDK